VGAQQQPQALAGEEEEVLRDRIQVPAPARHPRDDAADVAGREREPSAGPQAGAGGRDGGVRVGKVLEHVPERHRVEGRRGEGERRRIRDDERASAPATGASRRRGGDLDPEGAPSGRARLPDREAVGGPDVEQPRSRSGSSKARDATREAPA
jgi:hypothetical protein